MHFVDHFNISFGHVRDLGEWSMSQNVGKRNTFFIPSRDVSAVWGVWTYCRRVVAAHAGQRRLVLVVSEIRSQE